MGVTVVRWIKPEISPLPIKVSQRSSLKEEFAHIIAMGIQYTCFVFSSEGMESNCLQCRSLVEIPACLSCVGHKLVPVIPEEKGVRRIQ